jgi:hypothetical protein
MSAKPRSDSLLKNMPEDYQDAIAAWCKAPKTEESPGGLQHAREMLASDGHTVSLRAVSEFYSWYRLRSTFRQANDKASNFEAMLKAEFPTATPDKIAQMGQMIFTLEANNAGDVKTFIDLESLRLAKTSAETKARQKEKDIKLAERRVQVMEAKIAQATDTLKDGALSPAEREARMKQIFGIS